MNEGGNINNTNEVTEFRLRKPRAGEIFGIVTQMLGGSRMRVDCKDGKERICRIPGKIGRRVWIKVGDVVLIKPWSVQSDERGDISYRYSSLQVEQLRKKHIINF